MQSCDRYLYKATSQFTRFIQSDPEIPGFDDSLVFLTVATVNCCETVTYHTIAIWCVVPF